MVTKVKVKNERTRNKEIRNENRFGNSILDLGRERDKEVLRFYETEKVGAKFDVYLKCHLTENSSILITPNPSIDGAKYSEIGFLKRIVIDLDTEYEKALEILNLVFNLLEDKSIFDALTLEESASGRMKIYIELLNSSIRKNKKEFENQLKLATYAQKVLIAVFSFLGLKADRSFYGVLNHALYVPYVPSARKEGRYGKIRKLATKAIPVKVLYNFARKLAYIFNIFPDRWEKYKEPPKPNFYKVVEEELEEQVNKEDLVEIYNIEDYEFDIEEISIEELFEEDNLIDPKEELYQIGKTFRCFKYNSRRFSEGLLPLAAIGKYHYKMDKKDIFEVFERLAPDKKEDYELAYQYAKPVVQIPKGVNRRQQKFQKPKSNLKFELDLNAYIQYRQDLRKFKVSLKNKEMAFNHSLDRQERNYIIAGRVLAYLALNDFEVEIPTSKLHKITAPNTSRALYRKGLKIVEEVFNYTSLKEKIRLEIVGRTKGKKLKITKLAEVTKEDVIELFADYRRYILDVLQIKDFLLDIKLRTAHYFEQRDSNRSTLVKLIEEKAHIDLPSEVIRAFPEVLKFYEGKIKDKIHTYDINYKDDVFYAVIFYARKRLIEKGVEGLDNDPISMIEYHYQECQKKPSAPSLEEAVEGQPLGPGVSAFLDGFPVQDPAQARSRLGKIVRHFFQQRAHQSPLVKKS